MAILITGGSGYIGSHTTVELLSKGEEIILVDNLSNSKPEVIDKIKKIAKKDFKFYQLDIRNQEELQKVFTENKIEAVIHFAGFKAVGESVSKPLAYYANNIGGTLTLLDVMKQNNVKKIIFSSSATVYGKPAKVPITESMPISATNPYGMSKLIIEQILQDLYIADNNWDIAILRYFNPVGAHKSGLIGENPNGIPNNLMPYISQVASGKLPYLTIFGSDYKTHDGTGVRDYIHVVDLAKGHLKALEKLRKVDNGIFIYNLGTGTPYSVLDVIKAFEKANDIKINYIISDRRPGDIDACYADVTKAIKELNWQAEKNIEDMCQDAWNFERNLE